MAELKYNIQELFADAFGINAPIYRVPNETQGTPTISYQGIQGLPENYKSESKSWMGTPIIFQSTFKGGTYNRYNLIGEIETVSLNDFQLPAATMFSFRRGKNIERTNLSGTNGTVKEIYGFDDWIIDVKGLCLDEPEQSAHSQYEGLLKWEELADAIEISGHLFNQKKIDAVAIIDWNDNVVQGKPGTIPFSFQLISDQAIELAIPFGL